MTIDTACAPVRDTDMTPEEASELAAAEKWLGELDPETTPFEDPVDLRRIGSASRAIDAARERFSSSIPAPRGEDA